MKTKYSIVNFIILMLCFCLCSMTHAAQAQQKVTIHEAFEVNPDLEMLISHEYYNGIKIKSIKIKQIEIKKNIYIKNREITGDEPNQIDVVLEITDTHGNRTEIFGTKPLAIGDYTYKFQDK